jgi:hypothetical protein
MFVPGKAPTQDAIVCGEPEGVKTSMDAKPTFQAQSARGNIDHLKITGGMGIYRKESGADTAGERYTEF